MRKDWDHYFITLAEHAATRATCSRAHVGCVLVRNRDVLATGYNGSLSGIPHCDDVGHDMQEGHCVTTVHAEANALCMAARNGHSTLSAEAYLTHYPCWTCFKLLVQAGIVRIVYGQKYGVDSRVEAVAKQLGIAMVQIPAT
jgi:dCMP deaminase